MINKRFVVKKSALVLMCSTLFLSPAFASKNNSNFLNGKPFAYLNGQISDNSAALDAINARISSLSESFASLQAQISQNTQSIAATNQQVVSLTNSVNLLGANVTQLAADLFDHQALHQRDVDNLQSQLSNVQSQINGLTDGLNSLATQLNEEVASLKSAIAANSGEVQSLSISVSLLSADLSLAQNDILELLNNSAKLSIQLEEQQAVIEQMAEDIAALQALIEVSDSGSGSDSDASQEFSFSDTTSDDLDGSALTAFFQNANSTADSYIFVEGNVAGNNGAWCSTNAKFYSDSYLNTTNGSSISGNWDKWSKLNGAGWTQNNRAYYNYYGSYCGGTNGWCSEWSMGGNHIAVLPSNTGGDELYNNGYSDGSGSYTVRIATTRIEACGF